MAKTQCALYSRLPERSVPYALFQYLHVQIEPTDAWWCERAGHPSLSIPGMTKSEPPLPLLTPDASCVATAQVEFSFYGHEYMPCFD